MTLVSGDVAAVLARPTAMRIVRLPVVKILTGLGRSTVYERIREGKFPKPVGLGGRNVGWVETEIAA